MWFKVDIFLKFETFRIRKYILSKTEILSFFLRKEEVGDVGREMDIEKKILK